MELRMSHYGHKSILDAKLESGSSSSSCYDVTKFRSEEGNKSSNSAIYPRKTSLTLKKMSLYILLDPKVTHYVNFSNFQVEENFSFCKFLGCLDEKRAAATPWLIDFAEIWSEDVLKRKTKIGKVWASQS